MDYPKTGNETYVSFSISNTMLEGLGKSTITREPVSADYLKELFAKYGVIVSIKPEQQPLLRRVNELYGLNLEIPESLKIIQLRAAQAAGRYNRHGSTPQERHPAPQLYR